MATIKNTKEVLTDGKMK